MAEPGQLFAATGSLYEAAVHPDAWPSALSALGALVDSDWSLVGMFGRDGRCLLLDQDPASSPDVLTLFGDRYCAPDTNPSIGRLLPSPAGTVVLREQHLTDAEWSHSGLYRDIYRPRGLYHGLGACALSSPSLVALLGMNRAVCRDPFTQTDLKLLRAALPHLRRALEIYLKLESYKARRRADESVWDSLTTGVILLDAAGKVLWSNRAANALLEPTGGLTVRNGGLTAVRPADNAALQPLIREAIAITRGRTFGIGGVLNVSRGAARRALSVLVAPLHTAPSFVRPAAAVVFVTDPEREPVAATELLKRLYGLTNREAELTSLLMRGVELREAAEQLGVSLHTARTFLRYVFRKTATRRQSELVSFLLRGPAGLLSS